MPMTLGAFCTHWSTSFLKHPMRLRLTHITGLHLIAMVTTSDSVAACPVVQRLLFYCFPFYLLVRFFYVLFYSCVMGSNNFAACFIQVGGINLLPYYIMYSSPLRGDTCPLFSSSVLYFCSLVFNEGIAQFKLGEGSNSYFVHTQSQNLKKYRGLSCMELGTCRGSVRIELLNGTSLVTQARIHAH